MWAEGPAKIDLFSDRFGLPIVLGTRSRRFPSAKTWGRLRRTSIRGHTLSKPDVRTRCQPKNADFLNAVIANKIYCDTVDSTPDGSPIPTSPRTPPFASRTVSAGRN